MDKDELERLKKKFPLEDLEKLRKRKLNYLLDGVEKVLNDSETMAIHLQHLRQMGKWVKGRQAIDVQTPIKKGRLVLPR